MENTKVVELFRAETEKEDIWFTKNKEDFERSMNKNYKVRGLFHSI